MKNNQIGNIVLGFAILSSLFTVFRVYFYFFTGHDLSPLNEENKVPLTMAMIVITGIAYITGYGLKGKL